jgi:hypothetical protein
MARKSRVKSTMDYNKLAARLATNIVLGINELGKTVNKTIMQNLDAGVDIKGKSFEKLKDSTVEIRERNGWGSKPLQITGTLRERQESPATPVNPVFKIEMTGKGRGGFPYGGLHNQGYTTDAKSAIPGKKVPARKWFGVPDSCRYPGKDYKKFLTRFHLLTKAAWHK